MVAETSSGFGLEAPFWSVWSQKGASLLSRSLPEGTVGESYSAALEATGGTAPYTWGITGGSLPNGLELDSISGEIYGTPTVGGQFDFTAKLPVGEVTVSIQPAWDPDTQALLQVVQVSRPDVQPLSGVLDVSIASSSKEETKQMTLMFHFSPEQGDDDPDTWFITLLNDDGSISVIPANEIIRGGQGNVTSIKAELPHLSKYLLMKYNSPFTDLKAHWARRDVLLMAEGQIRSRQTSY